MANRKRIGLPRARALGIGTRGSSFRLSPSLLPIFAAWLLAGCASPSEPLERKPPTPEAVTDLAAEQSGNDVLLTFTLPKDTVDRRPLGQTPAIEIYRDIEAPAKHGEQIPAPANPTLLAAIPAALTSQYGVQGRVRYPDALTPSVFDSSADRT